LLPDAAKDAKPWIALFPDAENEGIDQRVRLPVGTSMQHTSVDHSLVSIMRSGDSAARKTLGILAARPPHLRDLGGYGNAGDDDDDESGSDERNAGRKKDEVQTAENGLTED
jgi:hypothetical protein